ncbi:hypothetical protein KQX54_016019 [Cotesia glomerata]|uniref:Uncharacterized protein n=1 Tax=Cotesia glomerata TaxID=32391 RepID=A0AAV7INK3_COTGL|nr:hypothetical protein KQX54_016019 [Cotesia glomerata]
MFVRAMVMAMGMLMLGTGSWKLGWGGHWLSDRHARGTRTPMEWIRLMDACRCVHVSMFLSMQLTYRQEADTKRRRKLLGKGNIRMIRVDAELEDLLDWYDAWWVTFRHDSLAWKKFGLE